MKTSKLHSLAVLLVLGLVALIGTPAHAVDISGDWAGTFDWGCDGGAGNAVWSVQLITPFFGTFVDNYGNSGPVLNSDSASVFVMIYTSGCRPLYIGNLTTDDHAEGPHICRPPSSGTGCWQATRGGAVLVKRRSGNPASPE